MGEMRNKSIGDYPDAALERALIEEYLTEQGQTFEDVAALDDDERLNLMAEAEAYAALRMGELSFIS